MGKAVPSFREFSFCKRRRERDEESVESIRVFSLSPPAESLDKINCLALPKEEEERPTLKPG